MLFAYLEDNFEFNCSEEAMAVDTGRSEISVYALKVMRWNYFIR